MKWEIHKFAHHILYGRDLDSKLISPREIDFSLTQFDYPGAPIPDAPGRSEHLQFSDVQVKFPRRQSLKDKTMRGRALHFFANHELLAIEMLAAIIVYLPCKTEVDLAFKKTCLATLADEQKHFCLYLKRMNDFSVQFGDYPLNDFFWDKMVNINNQADFTALLSMTFEAANLDFSLYYANLFEELGDHETSEIMRIIHRDEITHVKAGVYWMNKWRDDQSLWEYYLTHLPALITPARAKGMIFDRKGREQSGLDADFIERLIDYQDDFRITNRKKTQEQESREG
jgi:uncharacterized ferritin-like protein (DUF455 family)